MVLSRNEVLWLATSKRLIAPFDAKQMGPCSYDLTFSGQFYCYDEEDGDTFVPRELGAHNADAKLRIPPNGCAFLLTEEVVNMPRDVMGQISLRFGLTKLGIMLSPQAPIDPGYNGRIMMMLYNLSDHHRSFGRGDSFVTIAFHKLSEATTPYGGPNQGLTLIGQFFPRQEDPVRTSIAQTEEIVRVQSAKLNTRMQRFEKSNGRVVTYILAVIGVILACATLIAALLAVLPLRNSKDSPSPTSTATVTVTARPTPTVTNTGTSNAPPASPQGSR